MNDPKHSRHVLKSIGAVVAGLLVGIILSLGTDLLLQALKVLPPWTQPMSNNHFVLVTVYRVIFAIVGSYVGARLAPNQPMKHALVLGVIGFLLSTLGLILTWNAGPEFGPKWYPIALILTSIPCAWVGGKLRTMQLHGNAIEA